MSVEGEAPRGAEGVVIEAAGPGDAAAVLALQRLAYRSEAARYDDWGLAPLQP